MNEIIRIARLPIFKYVKNNVEADVKFELDSDNGYMAAGNDWSNLIRGLYWEMTRQELSEDGWIKVGKE